MGLGEGWLCPGGGERRTEGRVIVGTLRLDEAIKCIEKDRKLMQPCFNIRVHTYIHTCILPVPFHFAKSRSQDGNNKIILEISCKVQCTSDKRNAGKFAKMNVK